MFTSTHRLLGLGLAFIFFAVALWGMAAWLTNRDPGKWYWRLLAAGQAGLGLQIAVGAVLLITRDHKPWLHYVYGGFPVLVLVFAHRWSNKIKGLEWAVFSLASFFIFGLQLRGLMTGSGLR